MSFMVAAVICVSYKATVKVPGKCAEGQIPNRYTNICMVDASETQVKFFDDIKDFMSWKDEVPKDSQFNISDLHIYKEEPELMNWKAGVSPKKPY